MFYKEFQYPLLNNLDFIENNYQEISLRVQDWERGYYAKFNEKKFISLIT